MRYWVGVASKDHVKRGVELGVAQIGHGKRSGLARMRTGDWLIYYSPRQNLDSHNSVQAFTAIGQLTDDEIWEADEGSFKPWRRAIDYKKSVQLPIRPMLAQLFFTKGKQNWGYVFRFGLLQINKTDFEIIAKKMKIKS